MKQKNSDLTQGSIGWKLLLFALPLLGSSLIQQLYNTVDLMFVGNLLGKGASAAVGTCGWPINCLVGFFTGMGVGVGVLVSQACGAKDSQKVKQIIAEQLGKNEQDIKNEASFIEDLGADSLDTVELVMALEDAFKVQIPDEQQENLRTVQQAIDFIKANVKA